MLAVRVAKIVLIAALAAFASSSPTTIANYNSNY